MESRVIVVNKVIPLNDSTSVLLREKFEAGTPPHKIEELLRKKIGWCISNPERVFEIDI